MYLKMWEFKKGSIKQQMTVFTFDKFSQCKRKSNVIKVKHNVLYPISIECKLQFCFHSNFQHFSINNGMRSF